jgi:hypothetical protein
MCKSREVGCKQATLIRQRDNVSCSSYHVCICVSFNSVTPPRDGTAPYAWRCIPCIPEYYYAGGSSPAIASSPTALALQTDIVCLKTAPPQERSPCVVSTEPVGNTEPWAGDVESFVATTFPLLFCVNETCSLQISPPVNYKPTTSIKVFWKTCCVHFC